MTRPRKQNPASSPASAARTSGESGALGSEIHDDDPIAAIAEKLRTPFDPALTDHARLRIQAALVALPPDGSIRFTALRRALDLTDGNLGRHLAVLTEVGYVTSARSFRGRRPTSWYRATPTGRQAYARHVDALREVIDVADGGPDGQP